MIATGRHLSYEADYNLGKKNEPIILPKLKTYFQDDGIVAYEERFSKNDFIGTNGVQYELKSRRNQKTKYSTTLLACNKVIASAEQIFVWSFTDKNCYLKKDMELFKTFKTEYYNDCREGRGEPPKLHYLIPITCLTDF
jgi:hypothetical protein